MRRLLLVVLGLVLVAALALGALAAVLYLQGGPELVSESLEAALLYARGGAEQASATISAPGLAAEPDATRFHIVSGESEVRFLIDEVLRGADFTVIGTTSQIAGDIRVVPERPADSTVGLLRINVRTLQTDDSRRDRALRTFILRSSEDEYEFAEFETRALQGLPERITPGESYDIQLVGDLRVAGAGHELTFDATVTLESPTRLTAQARATLLYTDLDLTIPDVPFVSSVEEEVTLEIDLVALATAQEE